MSGLKLANFDELMFARKVEDFQNILIKYDKDLEAFRIGFLGQRQNPGVGELKYFPVWITSIAVAPVARQMLGSELVDMMYERPGEIWWAGLKLEELATDIINTCEPHSIANAVAAA